MTRQLLAACCFLTLLGCHKPDLKVLIGGTAIVAPGAQPIADSVIVVAGKSFRSVGIRKDIPIPQDSERTDVTGKWVVPQAGGRMAPGEEANLLVLDRSPNDASPRNDADVSRRMVAGEWR